ncbi:MAG: hypothetical protein JXA33_18110 [Anaerolineae bacterium]|nr:hypothetical protein [Anaerolineae bacterium]
MSEQQSTQTTHARNPIAILLLVWAVGMGALVRLIPAWLGGTPVLDGGLFYTLVEDLRHARYMLPQVTTYNLAQIPFAYPPLAFYLTAVIADLTRIPTLQLIRWLPPIVSIFAIPAFYALSLTILESKTRAALATVAFAMLPASFDLFVTGGGVARSPASVFALLTLTAVYRLFSSGERKYVPRVILYAGLLILTHPEITYHTFFIVVLFWLFRGRTFKSIGQSLLCAGGILVLTSPWWVTLVLRYGIQPFYASLSTGMYNLFFWVPLVQLDFGHEIYLTVVMALGMLGILVNLMHRDFLLLTWLVLPFMVDARNPYFAAAIPLAMLASAGMRDVILPQFGRLEQLARPEKAETVQLLAPKSRHFRLVLGFFLIYTLFSAYTFALELADIRLTPAEMEAMAWIQEETLPEARFLVLTYGDPFGTPVQEWFPALTGRVSLTVVQGYEWLPAQFYQRKQAFLTLQSCVFEDVRCVETWAEERNLTYDYIFVHRGLVGTAATDDVANGRMAGLLLFSLEAYPDYTRVYENDAIQIFKFEAGE